MAERDPGELTAADPESVRRTSARDILRRSLAHIADKTTDMADGPMPLHKSVYTDEARHAAEIEHLFLGHPIVAGLSGDCPEPGDVFVFDAAGPSIIVARGKDGEVRAFRNMCTHRGARLIEETEPWSGRAPRITCPFHAWTFDASGKLVGQPGKRAFADCAIGARDLIELPCAEHLGLIFVRAGGGDPIDAEAHLGDFAPILEQIELHRAQPVKKGVLEAASNWKFALDTYGEGYHFKTLHASTIGQTHHNDMAVYDAYGRHHRISFPDRSLNAHAGAAEADWPQTDYGGVHYIFPNTVVFFGALEPGSYFTQVFRLFPDGVGRTRCQFGVYAPFGITDDNYRATVEAAYDGTATVVQEEDYRVASGGYANLLYAPDDFNVVLGANEIALQNVHRSIADAIGMALPGADAG